MLKQMKNKLVDVKGFTKDIIEHMILKDLKQYLFLVMKLEIILLNNIINMHVGNDKNNHLAKYIKEFKMKARPQKDSKLKKKKVKEDVLNSAMTLVKGRRMVFQAFES